MESIMIVDKEKNILEEVKNILENDFNVVTAENSRKAFEIMDFQKEKDFGLILIDSLIPDTDTPALFSMRPDKRKNIDTTKKEDFLKKPFTKEQLMDFVKKKI